MFIYLFTWVGWNFHCVTQIHYLWCMGQQHMSSVFEAVGFCFSGVCRILVLWSDNRLASHVLPGRFLTNGPPAKSSCCVFLKEFYRNQCCNQSSLSVHFMWILPFCSACLPQGTHAVEIPLCKQKMIHKTVYNCNDTFNTEE